jgi:hypothetical protein
MRNWSRVRASFILPAALILSPALVLSSSAGLAATKATTAATPAKEPAIDPQAKEALTRMSDYVKSLSSFSLHELSSRDQVINNDLKVQKTAVADVSVRRPDRFKAVIEGDDGKDHTLLYDGKTLTAYMPSLKYYAQTNVTGSIADAVDTAEARYGVEFPSTDFLRMVGGEDFTKDLTAAGYVGPSRVFEVPCEHYAYRTQDVDYQLWIQKGDKPLPLKIVITSKKQPTQPQYTAIMTWDTSQKFDDALFAFTPPAGTAQIPFGAPPPEATKPPKAAH